jgi:hypothetical protein
MAKLTIQVAIDFIESERIFDHGEKDDCKLCESWQTLKSAALAQQTTNSAMDAIAERYINEVAFLDSSDTGAVRSFVAYLQQQHQ